MKVHNDQLKDNSMCDGPRNLRQVRIVKYRPTEKKKNRVKDDGFTNVKLTNFADHYQHAHHMLHSHPFVQHVANSKDKSPVLILYTNEQLIDFRRSCFAETMTESSVVGCDKTFNPGPLHLTTTVFKQPSVMRTTTGEIPIFFGPMCVHGNSDFSTWSIFFKYLATVLDDAPSDPVFGSDDEKALTKSIEKALPNSHRLTCTRHIKENCIHKLQNKLGICDKDRSKIIQPYLLQEVWVKPLILWHLN